MDKKKVSALDKIDMANCYRLVADMSFFETSDGPEHLLNQVTHEIRQFAVNRLEMLLGDKPSDAQIVIEPMALPFSEKDINILKMLISSVENNGITNFSQEKSEQAEDLQDATPVNPSSKKRQAKKKQKNPQGNLPASEPMLAGPSQDASVKPSPRYQKVAKTQKPIPMPSQAEIDQIHAQEATTYSGAFDSVFSGSITKLLKE